MKKSYAVLWAGNDESFCTYMNALESSAQHAKGFSTTTTTPTGAAVPESDEPKSRLLSVVDGVGILTVHGTLTNTDAWYNRYYGLVSYGEIIEALYEAAMRADVKEILMDVGSPGGAVGGVLDAVSAVEKVGKVKPITAFTSSIAASGGYWLIAPAKKRYATATAITGSIGVVAKHVEHSKYMEEAGIKETLIRAGEFKQLANSSEPLSKKAEKMLQEQVDYTYGIFVGSVAEYLGVTYQQVDQRMAQGKEFIGQQGVDHGLLTAVDSFEDVFARIQTRIQKKNGGTEMKKKYGMTGALALAAATAGVELPETPAAPPEGEVLAPEAAAAPVAAPEPETAPAEAAATKPEKSAGSEVVNLLKAQVKEKDEEILNLRMKQRELEGQEATLKSLKEVVARTINNMAVALGGSKDDKLAEKEPAALLAMYDTYLAKTVESFKVGGVAALGDDDNHGAPAKPTRYDAALSKVSKVAAH